MRASKTTAGSKPMTLNHPNTSLKDLILVEQLIPQNICNKIIEDIEKREWRPHTWYNAEQGTFGSEETKELDVQNTTDELQDLLTPFVIQMGGIYNSEVLFEGGGDRTRQIMSKFSKIRFNRYVPGQIMRTHIDHIKSLFSPPEQGIPVLSMIICLNDNYEGGELVFWDDYKIKPAAGSIIAWPSLFLYPHRVDEVTAGKRFSAVVWCW
jgi:predicted 2-oxoglutarate/Fe(II)-dependent dioxygenase YbiX